MMAVMIYVWVPLLVFTSSVFEVLSACNIPENLDFLIFTPLNGTNIYMVSCRDPTLKLLPLWNSHDIQCEADKWMRHVGQTTIDLKEFGCVNICKEPSTSSIQYSIDEDYVISRSDSGHVGPISKQFDSDMYYIPGVKINLQCPMRLNTTPQLLASICDGTGQWVPPIPSCAHGETYSISVEEGITPNRNQALIISITVTVVVLSAIIIMVTIAVRSKWRVVCRKRSAATAHPDDSNYPHGYMQLGSGPPLPSYSEAIEECGEVHREEHHIDFRPPTSDYRRLSSLESSSRGESESLSAGSHRHSLFSGSSSNYRNALGGDDISDILLQGDHLSVSDDSSTLVTVNTYESNPNASNPSLSHSRKGVAGSMVSNTATSMDDAPLIVRRSQVDSDPDDPCCGSNLE